MDPRSALPLLPPELLPEELLPLLLVLLDALDVAELPKRLVLVRPLETLLAGTSAPEALLESEEPIALGAAIAVPELEELLDPLPLDEGALVVGVFTFPVREPFEEPPRPLPLRLPRIWGASTAANRSACIVPASRIVR